MKKKKQNKRITTIYVENDIYRQIKIIAANKDKRINECIVESMKEYINKNLKYLRG